MEQPSWRRKTITHKHLKNMIIKNCKCSKGIKQGHLGGAVTWFQLESDLKVMKSSPTLGSAFSVESSWVSLCLPLPLPSMCVHSLSFSKINK